MLPLFARRRSLHAVAALLFTLILALAAACADSPEPVHPTQYAEPASNWMPASTAARLQAIPSDLPPSLADLPSHFEHPALFLVGDSTLHTGSGNGDYGPWGWASEAAAFFDPARLHVYNVALGGRSSRSYIEEGVWAKIRDQIQPGDFVLVQFGHNDNSDSDLFPDRKSQPGDGDATLEVASVLTQRKKVIHTYGWYLRQYVADIKARGATPIVCSPVPRNQWNNDKIVRGLGGYALWAHHAATQADAFFLDLNNLVADHYDALGQDATTALFDDNQHTNKAGARQIAQIVAQGIRGLADCPLADDVRPELTSLRPRANSVTSASAALLPALPPPQSANP